MQTDRHTAAGRDRAIRRLRAITTGTALAGILGVAGFGALAGATYSGTHSAGSSVTAISVGPSGAGQVTTGGSGTGISSGSSSATTPGGGAGTSSSIPGVLTAPSGSGRVTTGGS